MDLGINGLRVLLTAGAAGIGLEIARAFVREGAEAAPIWLILNDALFHVKH